MPFPYAAVLFDMDGTLVDSERPYLKAETEVFARMGLPDPRALALMLVGIPAQETEELLVRRLGADFPLDRYRALRDEIRPQVIGDGIPAKPGARLLLERLLRHGVPFALATSSVSANMDAHLRSAGLRDFFTVTACRDHVEHGKPAPDLYLLAARELGVDPAQCVAVEDSNPGVAAAHAAGARVLLVPDMTEPDDEALAVATLLPDLAAAEAALFGTVTPA